MPSRVFLEDFDISTPVTSEPAQPAPAPVATVTPEMIEQARLAGYETGYKAGWDDAATAEAETQGRIGA
ncbi:MAG TPA: flagellar biosynthesis protein, partial [Rhodobacterales bacterium]|nr:flagellar biosynthesis protein [Rhodobacterales bacterium]